MHVVYALEATSNVLKAAMLSMVTLGVLLRLAETETVHVKRITVNPISRKSGLKPSRPSREAAAPSHDSRDRAPGSA